MSDDDAKALGLRALAAGFRWAGGVLSGGDRWGLNDPALDLCRFAEVEGHRHQDWAADGDWPDFRDPATLGVLLAQVREAHGFTHLFTTATIWVDVGRVSYGVEGTDAGGGVTDMVRSYREGSGESELCWSEAEALVSALEAAPK